MALTGLVMVGFLIMHMAGNLKMFIGPESFDHYAHWLKGEGEGGILYPIVPQGWFIWIFRILMLLAIVLHAYSAWALTVRARAARGPAAYANSRRLTATYSARTMRWGGVILGLFLVFHLLQFTIKAVTTGFGVNDAPYVMFVKTFQNPLMVLLYALWLVAVCMHVRHGIWSALTTLGANTSVRSRAVLNAIAWIIAVVLFVGFMVSPLAVLLGWIR